MKTIGTVGEIARRLTPEQINAALGEYTLSAQVLAAFDEMLTAVRQQKPAVGSRTVYIVDDKALGFSYAGLLERSRLQLMLVTARTLSKCAITIRSDLNPDMSDAQALVITLLSCICLQERELPQEFFAHAAKR